MPNACKESQANYSIHEFNSWSLYIYIYMTTLFEVVKVSNFWKVKCGKERGEAEEIKIEREKIQMSHVVLLLTASQYICCKDRIAVNHGGRGRHPLPASFALDSFSWTLI